MLVVSLSYMQILLPAVAALVPLLITPGLLFYYDVTPKILVLVFGVVFAIVLAARDRKWLEFFSANRPARWFSVLLVLQLVSLLLSTAWSTNPALSLNGGNWRRFG